MHTDRNMLTNRKKWYPERLGKRSHCLHPVLLATAVSTNSEECIMTRKTMQKT